MKNALEDRDPVAWAVVLSNGKIHDTFFLFKWEAEKFADSLIYSNGIIPLYHSPALTDAEREVLKKVLRRIRESMWNDSSIELVQMSAVIDGLLFRTK